MASNFNIRIEHAVLTFRNFAGARKQFNDEGKRNFCVYLDGYNRRGEAFQDEDRIPRYKYGPDWMNPNDLITALQADGWNVKWTKEREADNGEVYPARPYIKVNVKYNDQYPNFNPKICTVKEDGSFSNIDADTAEIIDSIWIDNADVIIKPYNYEANKGIENGKVSAELKTLYITPVKDADEDDDFDGKYSSHEAEEQPW